MMHRVLYFLPFIFPFMVSAGEIPASVELTLSQCLQRTVQNNPGLIPPQLEVQAQDGLIEQAGLLPNPELELEAENVLGTGEFQNFKGSETTLVVSQLFETAGKRSKRVRVAELDKQHTRLDLDIAQLEVLYQTADAFISLLAAQERSDLEGEFHQIAQTVRDVIRASVEAGKDSPIEEIRAQVMAESTQLEWNRSLQEQETARRSLAALMGEERPTFERVIGNLQALPTIADASAWLDRMSSHPELKKAENEMERTQASLELEKANGVPDVRIGGGVRYLSESDDGAFVLGLSVPLPLFNRNQGTVRAAQEYVNKAKAERSAKAFDFRSSIQIYLQTLTQNRAQLEHMQNSLLPQAQRAFDLVQEGYRQGKFPYLSVLDTQRSLFEIQLEIVETAEAYHRVFNELERLGANYDIQAVQN